MAEAGAATGGAEALIGSIAAMAKSAGPSSAPPAALMEMMRAMAAGRQAGPTCPPPSRLCSDPPAISITPAAASPEHGPDEVEATSLASDAEAGAGADAAAVAAPPAAAEGSEWGASTSWECTGAALKLDVCGEASAAVAELELGAAGLTLLRPETCAAGAPCDLVLQASPAAPIASVMVLSSAASIECNHTPAGGLERYMGTGRAERGQCSLHKVEVTGPVGVAVSSVRLRFLGAAHAGTVSVGKVIVILGPPLPPQAPAPAAVGSAAAAVAAVAAANGGGPGPGGLNLGKLAGACVGAGASRCREASVSATATAAAVAPWCWASHG